MRVEIKMPNLGYGMEAGKIAAWLKRVGDPVERGEPLAEIETDKTTIDMESLVSGTLVEISTEAGEDARVGEAIGYIEDGR